MFALLLLTTTDPELTLLEILIDGNESETSQTNFVPLSTFVVLIEKATAEPETIEEEFAVIVAVLVLFHPEMFPKSSTKLPVYLAALLTLKLSM